MLKSIWKRLGYSFGIFFALPSVFASYLGFDNLDLGSYFATFLSWLDDFYVRAFITVAAFFAVLLSIFKLGLGKVPLFKEQPKQLNVVAISLSLIGSLGIFFLGNLDFYDVIIEMQGLMGDFSAILLGAIFGLIFYHFFGEEHKDWGMAFIGIGVALIIAGHVMP